MYKGRYSLEFPISWHLDHKAKAVTKSCDDAIKKNIQILIPIISILVKKGF